MIKPFSNLQARDNDFLRQCLITARANPSLSLSEVVLLALEKRPEQFYLDYDAAYRMLHRALKTSPNPPFRYAARNELADDLVEGVRRVAEAQRLPLRHALTYVLHKVRPKRYYISYRQAMRIARRKLKKAAIEK